LDFIAAESLLAVFERLLIGFFPLPVEPGNGQRMPGRFNLVKIMQAIYSSLLVAVKIDHAHDL